jgi:LysM repeat protein
VDEEARGWPERWRQEPPWRGEATVELEAVEAPDPIAFGPTLAADGASVGVRAARSALATTCPFFRRETADGALGRPVEMPDLINRCAAYGDAVPQSLRQQQLVCLTTRHVDCPRFVRAAGPTRRAPRAGRTRPIGRAVIAAIAILLVSAVASVGFVLARGGLNLPRAAAATGAVNAATGAVNAATGRPSPSAVAAVSTATPAATPSPAPTPSPTPAPTPTPTPPATGTPIATSDRYALLQPCPDAPDCYVYTVRHGDNLTGIAKYFGVPLDTVRELNPWTQTRGLEPGQKLRLPPPTR